MRTIITFALLASAFAEHELHLRRNHNLEEIVSDLTLRMEAMEEELKDLRGHKRQLEDHWEGCLFEMQKDLSGNSYCKLSQKLVINPSNATTAIDVFGDVSIAGELGVDDQATFRNNVYMPGEDNDIEIEGDLHAHGQLEVCGFAYFRSDVTIEDMSSSAEDDHEDGPFAEHEMETSDDPDLIVKGRLTVEDDVIFEEDLTVEGDVEIEGDLELDGDFDCNGDNCPEPATGG